MSKVTEVREDCIVDNGVVIPVAPATPNHVKQNILAWREEFRKGQKRSSISKSKKQKKKKFNKSFGNIGSAFEGIQV